MKYETRISKIKDFGSEGLMHTIYGEKMSDLLANKQFSETIFFLLAKRWPKNEEKIIFDKILLSIIDHGMGTTSSLSTRFVASGGNSLNVAVGAGVLSIGDYHGGAIEKAMQQYLAWGEMDSKQREADIEEKIVNKKIIYGFGHKVYKKGDSRVLELLKIIEKVGFESKNLFLKETIESLFLKVKGKEILINIDGIIAILLLDFGFDPMVGKGIFLIGRMPGLVMQGYEELKYEKPVRRLDEKEINFIE